MIVHNVAQGSADWLALRLGMPTASEFHKIVTPGGKLSASARAYAFRLVTEQLLNRTLDSIDHLEWVQRGKELEPEAADSYEFEYDVRTVPVGFVTTGDGKIGASPDRLVGDAGLLEIKCLAPQNHLALLVDGPGTDYKPQVQGQLFVTGREWVDLYGYSQEMPPARLRTYRDEEYIAKLRVALHDFCFQREELLYIAMSKGMFAVGRKVQTPHELAHASGAEA